MVISLLIAIYLPFQLFLFAYAVLGPLHYLTEINWLNEKSFFLSHKNRAWLLIGFTVLASLIILARVMLPFFGLADWVGALTAYEMKLYGSLVFICLATAAALVFTYKAWLILVTGLIAIMILYIFPMWATLAGIFIPTLIHVYMFTLLFIFYGAIKSGNKMAFVEAAVLVFVPVVILVLPLQGGNYVLKENVLATFQQSGFQHLSQSVGYLLGAPFVADQGQFLFSNSGVRIQIFITFAYLYHYLNWFSKVSLIGWMKSTSYFRITILILIWILSICLYVYDYETGLRALFLLSLLHVTLEFPLNVISIKEITSRVFKHQA